jgi:hypothetical protein
VTHVECVCVCVCVCVFVSTRVECRLSRDLALNVVQKFMEDEAAAGRCFQQEYPGVDPDFLRSVVAGMCVCVCVFVSVCVCV